MCAVPAMPRMLIRLSADVPQEALEAFPWLTCVTQPAHTALVGAVADQEELQGVLHHLNDLGLEIVEVVTIPDDAGHAGGSSDEVNHP